MKHAATFVLAAVILTAGVLAAPATKPVGPAKSPQPASKPTAEPARVDPKVVDAFNERFAEDTRAGKAKFADVVAGLRELGALGPSEMPKMESDFPGKVRRWTYSLELGAAWDFGRYGFGVDEDGWLYGFGFGVPDWPPDLTNNLVVRPEDRVLQPGNKWYIIRSHVGAGGRGDARRVTQLDRVQARSPAEAERKNVARYDKTVNHAAGRPTTWPADHMTDIEVVEWFTPRLKRVGSERIDRSKELKRQEEQRRGPSK